MLKELICSSKDINVDQRNFRNRFSFVNLRSLYDFIFGHFEKKMTIQLTNF